MEEELVSVVMPTYNCAAFIEESVKSVLAQLYKNWELIIVDDCSTDNTKAILAPYLAKYPNIHYTCLEKNSGPAVARSEALKQVKGDYVAFLDSDDTWTSNKLCLQIDFMKTNKIVFSTTAYKLIEKDEISKLTALFPPKIIDYNKMIRLSGLIENSTIIYDRHIIGDLQVANIDEFNDLSLWLKILHKTSTCHSMQDVLAGHRTYPQLTKQDNLKLLRFHWHLCRDIERLCLIKTIWYILCWHFVKFTGFGMKKLNLMKKMKQEIEDSVLYYE